MKCFNNAIQILYIVAKTRMETLWKKLDILVHYAVQISRNNLVKTQQIIYIVWHGTCQHKLCNKLCFALNNCMLTNQLINRMVPLNN